MSANQQQEFQYLEVLCKQLYEATDPSERAAAEKALFDFSERQDCLQKCLMLLEQGSTAYAQLVAATTLTKLLSKPAAIVSLEERIQLRHYLLNHLATRSKLPGFVISSLCQLFARLTKISWFDLGKDNDFVFRSSVDTIIKQLVEQNRMEICSLGILLLAHLVAEINQQNGIGTITKHRKVAASFRDSHLFELFQLAIRLLQSALNGISNFNLSDETQRSLLNNLLQLAVNCLNFDFIGSIVDDSSDDNVSVQVPTSWRVAFADNSIVKLFYELYAVLPPDLGALGLSCLVQLSSIRRTIFSNNERQQFLAALVAGVKAILENPQGLSDQATYHEFCRLVARLKSNYQLSELMKIDDYPKIVRMIAEFTVQSLQMYQFSANSIHYLLSFWQRMISSMPYVKSLEPHLLEQFAPLVTKGYVESRVNLVTMVLREGVEDPLDDHSSLAQQMEQFSIISRCEYDKTCQLVMQMFDRYASGYQQAIQTSNQVEQTLEEWRLTWLVYTIGAAVAGRQACNILDEHDLFDGDLLCRVLQLMRVTDSRLPGRACEKIELAYLWFLEQFRKIYISDQVQKTSKVHTKLTEVLGLTDESMVLAVFVQKIITNLKYWSQSEKIVDDTLTLLNDLSIGYSSVRKLVRLPEVQFLLNNHTGEHFSFLGTNADVKTMAFRTTFYTALMRLLCVDLGEDEDQFEHFMLPLTNAFNELQTVFNVGDAALVGQETAKRAVIGLARDVRGIAFACNTKSSYLMLFDLLYASYLAIFRRAIDVWFSDPNVTTPVLRLFAELCQNRSGRLQFDMSSPNSILLFKETSKIICSYGSRVLTLTDIPKEQMYRMRLKGIMICFGVLRAAFCGGYVNFGVLYLYGDTCLDDVLNMFVKMVLTIPQAELLAYNKLSQNYYFLLESLAQDHMSFMSHLEPQIFVYILQTLHEGLTALDTMICTCCCTTLDHIIAFLYKRVSRANKLRLPRAGVRPEGDSIVRVLEVHPDILRQLLSTVMNVVMFEDCRCQWSMSRPLLGLILLQEEFFTQLKAQLIAGQNVDKQQPLVLFFDALMEGIERNLSTKNKDKFTQNLSVFRREVTDCLKGTSGNVLSSPDSPYVDMMS